MEIKIEKAVTPITTQPIKLEGYQHISESVKLIHDHHFVHFLDFRHWVNKALVLEFYNETGRAELRTAFESLSTPVILLSEEVRFPDGFYVKLGNTPIGLQIIAAMRALDLPTVEAPVRFNHVPIDLSIPKKAYDHALKKIIEIIDIIDPKALADLGVFCQSTFESTHGLTWGSLK